MNINFIKWVITSLSLCMALSISAQTLTPQKDAKKSQWGYVSSSGKWVVKPKFSSADEFQMMPNGKMRAIVEKDGLKGYIDEKGKVLGPGIVFQDVTPLVGDAMFVTVKDKKGVIDYNCTYLVKPEAESVEQLGDEGWIMTIKGKKGLLKNDGTWIIMPEYTEINTSIPGYFIVNKGGKAGLMQRQGSLIIPAKDFTGLSPLKDNFWTIKKGKKSGVVDVATGNIVVKPKYDKVYGNYLNGKYFVVSKGREIDLLDKLGKQQDRAYGHDVAVEEDSNNNALIIHVYGNNYDIYSDNYKCMNLVEGSTDNFHGFTRRNFKLYDKFEKKGYYRDKDREALKPFLNGNGYYSSPTGLTDYTSGKELSEKLFLMQKNNSYTYDVFKTGNFIPIGEINLADNGGSTANPYLKLVSGEYIDTNGTPVEVIYHDNAVIALKNKATDKYSTITEANSILNYFYDKIIPGDGKNFNYIAQRGDRSYISTKDRGLMENTNGLNLRTINGYTIILDKEGKLGLKKGSNILISGDFDDIEPLVIWRQGSERNSEYFKLYKDGKVALFDADLAKISIPFEKGYTHIGGRSPEYPQLSSLFYDSDLCFVCIDGDEGLWNLSLEKEVLYPSSDNDIAYPDGFDGFLNNDVKYTPAGKKITSKPSTPAGKKITSKPSIKVKNTCIVLGTFSFLLDITGLKGHELTYSINVYRNNGSKLFTNQNVGSFTVDSDREEKEASFYFTSDIYNICKYNVNYYCTITIKDLTTGRNIPVSGSNKLPFKRNR